MTYQLRSTITFVLPVQSEQSLVIEQINSCFKFSEQYPGLCEIIIVTDDVEEKKVYLLWLAMKLNKVSHPHVRTKLIRYTSKLDINDLIETGIKHALGQKIIIAANNPERTEQLQLKNANIITGDIQVTPHFLNINPIQETSFTH